MNRIKFLLFAVVAIGLVAWTLKLAPTLGANRSSVDASIGLSGAPSAVALRLEARRSELQAAVLKLGRANVLAGPPKAGKPDAPSPESFEAIRKVLLSGLSDSVKASAVVVVANESGALMGRAEGEPAAPGEGFDVAAILSGSGDGTLATLNSVPYLFYGLPQLTVSNGEVKNSGVAALGAPLIGDGRAFLSGIRSELGLMNLALLSGGKVVALDGDKAAVEAASKTVKVGPVAELDVAPIETLGPVALPLMTTHTQTLALRRAIGGTPYEVLATVSSAEQLGALAGFQKFGLGAALGLLLLAVAVTLLLNSGEEHETAMVMPPAMLPAPPARPPPAATSPNLTPVDGPPAMAQEASPDDFHFPSEAPRAVTAEEPAFVPGPPAEPGPEPLSDPFAKLAPAPPPPPFPGAAPKSSSPPPAPLPPTSPSGTVFDDEDGAQTLAYPVFKSGSAPGAPPLDPFAVGTMLSAPDEATMAEPGADATRVAAVPAELLRAAKQSPVPARPPSTSRSSLAGSLVGLDEERHFQEVFRDFVATRERCGEAPDGVTFEKFKAKLLKSKEQVVAKQLLQGHACKTVRFQVYVKEGKAALKATPIKD